MKARSCYAVRPAHCFVVALLWGGGGAAADDVSGLKVQRTPDNTQWRVQWDTVAGERYRLQKSKGLRQWTDVTEITATAAAAQFDDPGVADASRTFWRVTPLGDALNVSPVVASYQLGDTTSQAMLQVLVGGAEPAQTVIFYDNGVALGNAEPGQGDTWTFDLLWDGVTPREGDITAEVTGADGTVRTTPVKRLLLADPAKFVPLLANGKPAYGEFIPMDGQGALGAFQYFPEGYADAVKTSGAHFTFPAGATMDFPGNAAEIRFTSGAFYRGHNDAAPLNAAPGQRTLPVDSIQPQTVAAALGLPAGTPIPLLWGAVPLPWRSGALGESGWGALKVDLPLGDIPFPGTQSNATVAIDPASGLASLVVCFSGEWQPFDSGPQFRIPASDPLKIYLDTRGRFAANGTAEAEFPNGAVVRGAISWRAPNFEFRFQGRGLTIPALTSLRQVLPQNPEQVVPAGTGETELDEAARSLAAYRDTFRQLATGGAGQGDPAAAGTQAAPLAVSEDPAGAALTGWTARLESWNADRAGQVLEAAALTALKTTVENAAKLAVSAHDAPTVFKLARDMLSLARTTPNHAGNSPQAAELAATLTGALPQVFAAAKRVASAMPPDAPPGDVAEAARLLAQWSAANPARSPRGGASPAAAEAALQADELVRSRYGTFFDEYEIQAGDFDGVNNPALAAITSADGLIEVVEQVKTLLDLLKIAHPGEAITLDTPPPNYPLLETVEQTHVWIVERHNEVCGDAVTKGEIGPLAAAVRQRVRIFELYKALDYPIPGEGTDFLPPLREMALAMEEPFSRQLGTVSRELRLNLIKSQADTLRKAAGFLNDPLLNEYLSDTWTMQKNVNSEMAYLLFGAPDADELERVLTNSFGFKLLPLPENSEGTRNLPVNGKYESLTGRKTLQLSQAGRYVMGYLQTHNPGGSSYRSKLEGVLVTDTASKVEFAFILYPVVKPSSLAAGLLTAEIEPGTQRLRVKLKRTFPRDNQFTEEFRQLTNVPAFAGSVVNAFPGEPGRIVRAFNQTPLHTAQLEQVLKEVPEIIGIIERFAEAGSDLNAQRPHASAFNSIMRKIKKQYVTAAQLPLVRVVLQQALSKARPAGSARTYWEQVLVMLANHPTTVDVTAEMLGGTPATPMSGSQYTYTCTISADGIGGDFRALKLGGLLLKIRIHKSGPTGSDIFDLIGLVAQGGAGLELKKNFGGPPPGGGGQQGGLPELPVEKLELESETIVVQSPYDYHPGDLRGPVFGFSGEASIGAELKVPDAVSVSGDLVKLDGSGLALFGTGVLPPLVLTKDPDFAGPEPPEIEANFEAGELEFEGGFEATIETTVGYVTNEIDPLQFLTAPLPFRFEASAGSAADGAVFFDTDSAVIRPAGRQFLRRLVAEYAGVFVGTNPKIRILGMTDTAGTPSHNATLSLQRASSVRDAVIEIAGPLGFAPEDILAIGLGEEAAAGIPPGDIAAFGPFETAEPWLLDFIARRQGAFGTIPDGTGGDEGAPWRSVVILINNVASLELTDPGDPAP